MQQPIDMTFSEPSVSIISQTPQKVKTNLLRDLRIGKNIPAKEIVEEVKKAYPKYDKTLQSKCERGDEYGVELRGKALRALIDRYYLPEEAELLRRKRDGNRRLNRRLGCRMEENAYAKLIQKIKTDGYSSIQAWLIGMIDRYLKEDAGKGEENVRHGKSD